MNVNDAFAAAALDLHRSDNQSGKQAAAIAPAIVCRCRNPVVFLVRGIEIANRVLHGEGSGDGRLGARLKTALRSAKMKIVFRKDANENGFH